MDEQHKADLHCHSTCSDGTKKPEELVLLAKMIGLQGLAITDHDNVNAYRQAIPAAEKTGLSLLNGVEFSTLHGSSSVHILGYGFIQDHPAIEQLCRRHRERRRLRNEAILSRLSQRGMPLDADELYHSAEEAGVAARSVGRPHIAHLMVRKGYVNDVAEAFNSFLGDHSCCFVQCATPSAAETIEVLHSACGKVVLAHPHLLSKSCDIASLIGLPFDGIEVHYGTFALQSAQRWKRLAEQKGLFWTGGSDYHGDLRPAVPLGASWTPWPLFEELYALCRRNNG